MKTYELCRLSSPNTGVYEDQLTIFDETTILWQAAKVVSTWPNWIHPIIQNNLDSGKPFDLVYACIAPGMWPAVYEYDDRGKLCFVINNGERIPTLLPNWNHGGAYYAEGVEFHKGDQENWRGSKACFTGQPSRWNEIVSFVRLNETVMLVLRHDGM